jgi:HSP20 family molecular chaperone IbpA
MFSENFTTNIYENDGQGVPQIMRTDIQEKDGNFLLEIELPGYLREDIQAELNSGILTIIANRPEHLENEINKTHYIRRERLVGGCKRSFYVGDTVKQEDISAAFSDGVLSIIVRNASRMVDREERKLIPIK